jgi:hypothetical protein
MLLQRSGIAEQCSAALYTPQLDQYVSLSHILPTWSLTLKEEHRLRMVNNLVLRKICGPKGKK